MAAACAMSHYTCACCLLLLLFQCLFQCRLLILQQLLVANVISAPRKEYGTVPAGGSTGLPFRRRTAIGSVAMLTLALAALVALTTLSSERSQSTILNQMQQLRNLEQQLMAANPSMTPLEAQQQAQLMEEGSITVDPNSENPAADFYANADDSDIGDEDVEDAGPGNHLGGWYGTLSHQKCKFRDGRSRLTCVFCILFPGPIRSCWTRRRQRRCSLS
jgi:hypothetical protein